MRVEFVPAFLLHSRPYREHSALVDLLTRDHGRVSGVVRSARGGKRGSASLLRPFSPLHVSWHGRSDLKTISGVESVGAPWMLAGEAMFSGFYLNELLVRLLSPLDPHPSLFNAYALAVAQLAEQADMAPVLRRFEFSLLDALGYGIDFSCGGEPLAAGQHYRYDVQQGFSPCLPLDHGAISGDVLLQLSVSDFNAPEVQRMAGRLLRPSLQRLLGPKPMQSREMLLSFRRSLEG